MTAGRTRKKNTARNGAGISQGIIEIDAAFAPIAKSFRNDKKISLARMFGSIGLKVNGKVFVMLVKGNLVAKLPKDRVAALIDAGHGEHFDPGHGRVMKEWIVIKPKAMAKWLTLAKEARRFVDIKS